MPFQWVNNNPQEGTSEAKFAALVEIIRTEIRAGVDPLRGDVQNLKLSVDDVRRAQHQMQQQMYTREVVDLKLKERDDAIKDLEDGVKALDGRLGGIWANAITRVGAAVGAASGIAGLWLLLHR